MNLEIIEQFGIALGLGLLVGFQREWTAPHVAGIRTFALLTLFGTLCGMIAEVTDYWIISAGVIAVVALLIHGTYTKFDQDAEVGITTHAAAMFMYLVGVSIVMLNVRISILTAGLVAVLLHWKEPMHDFIDQFSKREVKAIIQLVLLALVILPVLPDASYDPYGVLNPFHIWLIVVLICGISLAGFIIYKLFGQRAGSVICGILGGIISSTATTVSYSSKKQSQQFNEATAVLVIVIASTVVFARVFVEVWLIAPVLLMSMFPPLITMMTVMLVISFIMFYFTPRQQSTSAMSDDPNQLKNALIFGALYALVLLATAFGKDYYGNQGLYLVAALSGLTDMDAITLSTARFIEKDQLSIDIGWRMILTGIISNLVFKTIVVGILGSRRMVKRILLAFGISILAGLAILFLWPTIS